MQLCVYSKGSISVLDVGNGRVLQLNSAPEFQKELLSWKDELRYLWKMCLDKSHGLMLVTSNYSDLKTGQKNAKIVAFYIK